MTSAERIDNVAAHGFTKRQAAFLTTVLLHGGVCVQRQVPRVCRHRARAGHPQFLRGPDRRRYATAYPCARRGAQHLSRAPQGALSRHWRAGQPLPAASECRTRHRAADAARRGARRPAIDLAGTEREKVAYCLEQRHLGADDLPALTFESGGCRTTRFFPHKLPLGVASGSKEISLLYVVTDASPGDFRRFLDAHRRLLHRLSPWRLLLVVPRALATAETAHRHVIADFCAPPLRPAVVDEFRWFCGVRRAMGHARTPHVDVDLAKFGRARRAFGSPRFYAAYQRWCREGDVSLHRLLSPALHDAQQRGHVSSKHWRFLMCMPTWVLSFRRRDGRAAAVSSRQTDRRMARGGLSIATLASPP